MKRLGYKRASILFSIILLALALTVAVSRSHQGPSGVLHHEQTRLASASAAPLVTAPSSSELAAATTVFGVFSSPSGTGAALPTSSAYSGGVSRQVGSISAPFQAWAVSEGDEVCVTMDGQGPASSGGPAACNTVAELSQPDQLLVDVSGAPSTSSSQVVAGLAPNGVSTVTIRFQDGTSTNVPVTNNGFTYTANSSNPISGFSWTVNGVVNTEGGQ